MSDQDEVLEVRIQKSIPEATITWLIQVIGVSAAVIFGIYTVLSWRDAETAKQQATTASLFSLLALCSQSVRSLTSFACYANICKMTIERERYVLKSILRLNSHWLLSLVDCSPRFRLHRHCLHKQHLHSRAHRHFLHHPLHSHYPHRYQYYHHIICHLRSLL
jgi:hypothetical protein